jgi:hypothetical protein
VSRSLPLLLALGLVAGCAVTPPEYRYRPPSGVGREDWRACHARADANARQRYDRYTEMIELVGPFGGPFGGITLAQRAWQERENFYEWEMKSCLRERGYTL